MAARSPWEGGQRRRSTDNIYLFDRVSGALKQRLSGLPDVVNHLAYSKDGRYLAATLYGKNGIRVFDVARGYTALPSDVDYSDEFILGRVRCHGPAGYRVVRWFRAPVCGRAL